MRLEAMLRRVFGRTKPEAFDHVAAQTYEFDSNSKWVEEHGREIVAGIIAEREHEPPRVHPLQVEEFFAGDPGLAAAFVADMAGKVVLEVGGGPAPLTTILTRRLRALHLIDPLVDRYDDFIQRTFGHSWRAPNVTLRAANAEERIPELVGRVDGAIVCRNCLDHTEQPARILENLAAYAAPGCILLLWTDLVHLDGHDEGHHDIARDPAEFERTLQGLGFRIVRRTPEKSGSRTVSYGCYAIRS